MLTRDLPWSTQEIALLSEWPDVWWHASAALQRPALWSWRRWRSTLAGWVRPPAGRRWWQQRPFYGLAALLLLTVFPVRLTVLAPGEWVPAHPAVIRAPLDGVIDTFHVQPDALVSRGQALFGFDEALIQTRLDVTRRSRIPAGGPTGLVRCALQGPTSFVVHRRA